MNGKQMFEAGIKVAEGSFELVVFDENTIIIKSHSSSKYRIYDER